MSQVLTDIIPQTAMEVFNMLPIGTRCEVIDNALYMSPSPTTDHQDIMGEIFFQIKSFLKNQKSGQVYIAPLDVYLDGGETVVQPDVFFVKSENSKIVEKKGIIGSPDLILEVLSTNSKHDKELKLNLYQQNRIPEYLIIDPQTKEVLHYLLVADEYYLQPGIGSGHFHIHQLDLQIDF